ncbi:MAG TPA: 2-C-methyl-D-erythritol 2,4-cyclodiphosphate synthase [Alcanivoracaceae bacterium]|nr:2-C-methyl-D-erythritol 2,4-cyclodiphosphate synthase [Alcanivoracaceae bacterium]
MARIRIGQGYDVHAFGEGDSLIIGGVRIPFHKGFVAHSDGDVLLHALTDALLGALALGDIGYWFPDTDAQWKGADSGQLLQAAYAKITAKGYQLANADLTVLAERPKMAPHIQAIRERISALLGCDVEAISVKATTTEKLGFVGREEGITALATVLVERVK